MTWLESSDLKDKREATSEIISGKSKINIQHCKMSVGLFDIILMSFLEYF